MAPRGTIASDLPAEALEPQAWRAIRSLGYEIVPARVPYGRADQPIQPDLWLVDEEGLRQIADEEGAAAPIILLTRQPAPPPADQRVIASLTRGAPFQELYAAIQEAIERTPRRHPRITTALAARCAYQDLTFTGLVISLSEGGCLFRGPEDLPRERQTQLQFPLPHPGLISTQARQVNRRGDDFGFAFQDLSSLSRVAISQYVMEQLVEN
jgi:hypothetical protein